MSEKRVNGKPMSHWEAEARLLVVDTLVRAWAMYEQKPGRAVSVIHEIAAKQFLALAKGISERDCQESIATMNRVREGMARTLMDGYEPRPAPKKPRRRSNRSSSR